MAYRHTTFSKNNSATLITTIFALSFLSISWLWPIHSNLLTTFHQDSLAFSAILFLFLSNNKNLKISRSLALLAFISTAPILHYLLNKTLFWGDTLIAFTYILAFSLTIAVSSSYISITKNRHKLPTLLAITITTAATLSAFIAFRQWLGLADSSWEINYQGTRPYANMAQPNNLATLLCMGVASLIYLHERRTIGNLLSTLITIILIFALVLTQSRTPWVSALFLLGFWIYKNRNNTFRLKTHIIFSWVCVYIVCTLLLPHIGAALDLPVSSLAKRTLALSRWDLWKQLWLAVKVGPVFGYGWNQINIAQVMVTPAYPLKMMTAHSHNILLDIMLWNGPIIGGLIITFFGMWLLKLFIKTRSQEGLYALICAGFILIHGLLEFPLEYAFFLLPFGIFLGIAESEQETKPLFYLPKGSTIVIAAVGFILLFLVSKEYNSLERHHFNHRLAIAKVVGFSVDDPPPKTIFLTQISELQKLQRFEVNDSLNDDQLEWMKNVVMRFPHLANLYKYILALSLNDKKEEAAEFLVILKGLHGPKYHDQALEELQIALNKAPIEE